MKRVEVISIPSGMHLSVEKQPHDNLPHPARDASFGKIHPTERRIPTECGEMI